MREDPKMKYDGIYRMLQNTQTGFRWLQVPRSLPTDQRWPASAWSNVRAPQNPDQALAMLFFSLPL